MEKFYLEIPSIERKEEALEYLKEHIDAKSKINGSGGLNRCNDGLSYEEWLDDVIKNMRIDYALINGYVPATTYFTIRKNDNKIIGMVNFRHFLNDHLRKYGGHIGYGIRPSERGKGYAKLQLYLALLEAKKRDLDKVMIQCFKENAPSDRTIKALGGILEREEYDDKHNDIIKSYWINALESIEKNKSKYDKYILKNNKRM